MSYSVPYSFIPGTKARAQDVNANFNSVTDYLDLLDANKVNNDLSNISAEGVNFIKNNSSRRNIGEIIYTFIPAKDANLHLLDGSLLYSGLYSDFIDYIADLYAENPSANYFCTENEWQTSVNTYGVCGKFVYDSTNNTVRLPKVTGIIEGTTDVTALGDLVEAGLPVHTHTRGTMNITGSNTGYGWGLGAAASGAFYVTGGANERPPYNEASGAYYHNFDASRSWTGNTSNPIYTNNIQNSSTVQPQTIKCFVYIVIATSSKTEIQTDIDEIATDLNGKADNDLSNLNTTGQAIINSKANTDLSNVTDTGYIKMAGASMPSNTQITLTLGADGATYTAPADGWVIVTGYNANSSITIWQGCTNMSNTAGNSGDYYTVMIPVRKGNFNVGYRGITLVSFKFIYAQGSESEAS